MSGFDLQRLGQIMEPEPGNPHEVEGVLNPAAVRGPDGQLYLFPRLVAKGNYSRIGIARVKFNDAGDPCGVERLGIALEPEADYERRPDGGGGCEDPRITFVEPLQRYVMTYTAFPPTAHGSRWRFRRICSTGSGSGSRRLSRIAALISSMWTTRTPASSPSPSPITAGKCRWPSSIARLFPGTRPEETACEARSRWWTSITKASGFPIARWPLEGLRSRSISACLTLITGWRLRSRRGSGSKSAAALRPS